MKRNTAYNVLGQLLVAATAVVTLPTIIAQLGTQRFGVLSFGWLVYFSVLDLGIGRATTQFAARAEIEGVRGTVARTSLAINAATGAALSLVFGLAAPLIAILLLRVSPDLIDETTAFFRILSIGIVPTFIAAVPRALLEARSRFGLANTLTAPIHAMAYVLPAIAALAGAELPLVAALLVATRTLGMLLLLMAAHSDLAMGSDVKGGATARGLLTYGGWTSTSNVLSPLLVYADRIIVATVLGAQQLGFYLAPFELVSRVWILPRSVAATLFPAFSAASRAPDDLRKLYLDSLRGLTFLLGVCVIVPVALSQELMRLWLGSEFSSLSGPVLRVLLIGIAVNAAAHVPFSLIQAIGRPDATAKLHLAEVPPYLLLAWVLTSTFGLVGAASAWTLRLAADAASLFLLAQRLLPVADARQRNGLYIILAGLVWIAIAPTAISLWVVEPVAKVALAIVALGGFAMALHAISRAGRPD